MDPGQRVSRLAPLLARVPLLAERDSCAFVVCLMRKRSIIRKVVVRPVKVIQVSRLEEGQRSRCPSLTSDTKQWDYILTLN